MWSIVDLWAAVLSSGIRVKAWAFFPIFFSELEVLGGAPVWVLKKLGAQYAATLRDTQGSRAVSAGL
jgi:hypothetical protein